MNPQENWDELIFAWSIGDVARAESVAQSLNEWLISHGSPPRTIAELPADDELHDVVARTVCRSIMLNTWLRGLSDSQ